MDCGVFLLMFAEILINHSEEFKLDQKYSPSAQRVLRQRFSLLQIDPLSATQMRQRIVSVIDELTRCSPVIQREGQEEESDSSELECLEIVIKKRSGQRLTVEHESEEWEEEEEVEEEEEESGNLDEEEIKKMQSDEVCGESSGGAGVGLGSVLASSLPSPSSLGHSGPGGDGLQGDVQPSQLHPAHQVHLLRVLCP